MGEGQPQRYNTDITKEYYYKYRPHKEWKLVMVQGTDRDILTKTWTGFKYGLFTGSFAGAVMFTYEDGPRIIYKNAIERAYKHGMPWVFAGTVYGLTVSTVANIRQEDGALNHFFGGLASGAMMGSWYKNLQVGRWCAVLFALTGSIFKSAADDDALPLFDNRKWHPLNSYRTGWFIKRPDTEGIDDGDKDDSFKKYRPDWK